MELSKQKQTEAKKLNVTVQYLVMADLMSIGYSEQDAYIIAFPENEALASQQNDSIRKNIVESAKFKKLLDNRKQRVKDGSAAPVSLDEVELVGTEEVLKEILRSAKQQPVGSKERADLYAKYNDIKKENEQGTEDETDVINFYFPAKCSQCPLLYAYNEEAKKCKNEKGEIIRPVEMGRVIKLSHKIIQAALDAEE
jgi:hypothetical protein